MNGTGVLFVSGGQCNGTTVSWNIQSHLVKVLAHTMKRPLATELKRITDWRRRKMPPVLLLAFKLYLLLCNVSIINLNNVTGKTSTTPTYPPLQHEKFKQ